MRLKPYIAVSPCITYGNCHLHACPFTLSWRRCDSGCRHALQHEHGRSLACVQGESGSEQHDEQLWRKLASQLKLMPRQVATLLGLMPPLPNACLTRQSEPCPPAGVEVSPGLEKSPGMMHMRSVTSRGARWRWYCSCAMPFCGARARLSGGGRRQPRSLQHPCLRWNLMWGGHFSLMAEQQFTLCPVAFGA